MQNVTPLDIQKNIFLMGKATLSHYSQPTAKCYSLPASVFKNNTQRTSRVGWHCKKLLSPVAVEEEGKLGFSCQHEETQSRGRTGQARRVKRYRPAAHRNGGAAPGRDHQRIRTPAGAGQQRGSALRSSGSSAVCLYQHVLSIPS